MKKQLKGKQSFYDDKQRENVVSYYLMEDQEHTDVWSRTGKISGRNECD